MSRDDSPNAEVNHLKGLWEIIPVVGAGFAFGHIMYLQGRVTESGLPAREWVQHATGFDLLMSIGGFSLGLAAMGVWLAVEVYYGRS